MKLCRTNTPKNFQINKSVMFTYWNKNEWEFTIDHCSTSKEKAARYETLAVKFTMDFASRTIPSDKLDDFVTMTKKAFAL